jgi:hypothetical protein
MLPTDGAALARCGLVPSARCAGASYIVPTVLAIAAEERREATLRRQQVSGEQSGLILLSPDPKCVYGDEIVTRPPFAQTGYVLVCKPFDRARFGQLSSRILLPGGCQVRRRTKSGRKVRAPLQRTRARRAKIRGPI